MKKICVIGHFGFGQTLLNGQTIKTKIITEEIEKEFGASNVMRLDLAGGIKQIPHLLLQIPKMLRKCGNVVIMPVENGLRFLVPTLGFWNGVFKRKIHYVVVGGWLPKFAAQNKWLVNGMKRFCGVYTETSTMKSALNELGVANVFVLPNCKRLKLLSENELVYPTAAPYKLCTFSRVMRQKGIEDAAIAVQKVNELLGYTAYSLDIYGQIDTAQTEWFENLQKAFPSYIRYCGCVDADKSVDTLKEYFVLLFPTYYEGEGFAGTLIDAFSAGIPVVATDWKYNSEIVNQNVGSVYPTGDMQALEDILSALAQNPSAMLNKKTACLHEAEKYKLDEAVRVLLERMRE